MNNVAVHPAINWFVDHSGHRIDRIYLVHVIEDETGCRIVPRNGRLVLWKAQPKLRAKA